jgi:hypothetical protein
MDPNVNLLMENKNFTLNLKLFKSINIKPRNALTSKVKCIVYMEQGNLIIKLKFY